MVMRQRALVLLSAFAISSFTLSTIVGCSQGSNSTGGTSPQITVLVSGPSATRLNGTAQFSATVSGTTNTVVSWQVNGVAGGSAASGTISAAGLYTAPAALPSSDSATISAVSVANATASGSVAEALQNPVPVETTATAVQIGSTLTYTVTVIGSGFVPTSVINAVGSAQTTTYISPTQ